MPRTNDKGIAIARVYARSLLELAVGGETAEALREELQDLVDYLGRHREFADFLTTPLVAVGQREKLLEKWLRGKASDLLVNALQVLNRKGRLALLPAIAEVYTQEHRQLRRQVEVHVKTAVPLTSDLRQQLVAALHRLTGQEPLLREELDSQLIGGIVLTIDDQKIDASLQRELAGRRAALHHRAALEIQRVRLTEAEA